MERRRDINEPTARVRLSGKVESSRDLDRDQRWNHLQAASPDPAQSPRVRLVTRQRSLPRGAAALREGGFPLPPLAETIRLRNTMTPRLGLRDFQIRQKRNDGLPGFS